MSEITKPAETKELTTTQDQDVTITPGFGSLASFRLAQRAATLLANSTLVPKIYQGNIPNCVIALNMAARMNADPLMVMQNLYIVHGNPGWSSQFLISTFNTSGKFSALRYEWVGTRGKDDWGCRAWAVEKATGEKLVGATVTIGLAKAEGWYSKNGSKWQTMPEQMLMYRAAAWFIRAYAPEIAMGMHTADELSDTVDLDPSQYTVEQEIRANANTETIDIDMSADEPEAVTPEPTQEPKPAGDKPKASNKGKPEQIAMGPEF